MPLSVNEELRRTFELATLRRESETIRWSRQWREVDDLNRRCETARRREQHLYAMRYDARVEQRRRQLIDEAGTKTRDFKPWWGAQDRFSPQATLRQAQREVRVAHQSRIQRIDDYQRERLKTYIARYHREGEMYGVARDGFNRAADRRTPFGERRQRWVREH